MKLCIVGVGLIGGSLALDLRARGFADSVVGVDNNPEHRAMALTLGLVDRFDSLEIAVAHADLVLLTLPVNLISNQLALILPLLKKGAIVCDMGSTKEKICQMMAQHILRPAYVASHPMAGTENSGPAAALMGLFDHKTAVICDSHKSDTDALTVVEAMYECLKMRIVYMTSSDHDLHAAYVSHLCHITSFVLANTVLNKEENTKTIFDLAGGGFESTVRLAKSSPAMWAPIFQQNSVNILEALTSYIGQLQDFQNSLIEANLAELQNKMFEANQIREVLANIQASPKGRK